MESIRENEACKGRSASLLLRNLQFFLFTFLFDTFTTIIWRRNLQQVLYFSESNFN